MVCVQPRKARDGRQPPGLGNEFDGITGRFNMVPGEQGPEPGALCKDIRPTQLGAGTGRVEACRGGCWRVSVMCPMGGLLVPKCRLNK